MALESKEALHRLVEELPEAEVRAAARYLEYLIRDGQPIEDPVLQALMRAPLDDEPLTPEEIYDLDRARRAVAEGRTTLDRDLVLGG